MNKSILLCLLLSLFSVSSCSDSENRIGHKEERTYSQQDWDVFNACKAKVYRNENNAYDYLACSKMLKHKKALKKHGASSSYNYWINRLYKN